MWDKIKDVLFHRVVARAAAAGVAGGVAYLSKPEVMASLAAAGVTIDPTKLTGWAMGVVTFVLALAYHFIEHKVSPSIPLTSVEK